MTTPCSVRIVRRYAAVVFVFTAAISLLAGDLVADGIADNDPNKVRRVPRAGIEVPEADVSLLRAQLERLQTSITALREDGRPQTQELLPDVVIFHRAVSDALQYNEFFAPGEIEAAKTLLQQGLSRAAELRAGKPSWPMASGLVVRGFVSRIDGSVQPYGLIVPPEAVTDPPRRVRLDLWFHGRGENLSEVNFLTDRNRNRGTYGPPETIVLHPYGRYSNAFKFAGEVDVLEALADVQRRYRVDDDRISVRGFSMGGAACWQFAVHYPDRWFAANPGAGFSETPEFLKFFQQETLLPPWYESTLWHWYNCNDVCVNLLQCPTVAYSGELDTQKQAADIMEAALKAEGIDLLHIIGPGTKHAIHPDSQREIEARMSDLAEAGREHVPREIRFTTFTLKYNRCNWITLDALEEHWSPARVEAKLTDDGVHIATKNIAGLTISMSAGQCPLDLTRAPTVSVDGQMLIRVKPKSDRSWYCPIHKQDGAWRSGELPVAGLRKKRGLQGPIDDAFMDSFLIVRPTGKAQHPLVDEWTRGEMVHTVQHWRQHFRGQARVKADNEIDEKDIAESNLILFGDPASNRVLAKIAEQLPFQWDADTIATGSETFDATNHALVMIYPNPLNPERYVVLNSGFTFREYDYLNNARQTPKLPDWAVLDLNTPPNSRWPGKIVAADFFGEQWEVRPPRKAE